MYALHKYGFVWVVTVFNSPLLVVLIWTTRGLWGRGEWEMSSKGALEYGPLTRRLMPLSWEPAVQANNPGSWQFQQTGAAEKSREGRVSPLVRKLLIKVTSKAASSSGIPPKGDGSSSKPMEKGDLKTSSL
jgi:hypothetical protein